MTGYIILAVLGLGVVLYFTWPAFRQMLRIRGNDAVSKGTTAVERNKDRYRELKGKLPAQRTSVAECMATVDDITKDLGEAEQALVTIQGEYKTAKEMKASDVALDALGKQFEAGEAKIKKIKGRLAEAKGASDEAQKALDDTIEALQGFADRIEDSELATHLTQALETSAAAKQQAKDINDKLSEASEDFDAVEHDLNVARNLDKLADGSTADRELKDIKNKAKATTGRGKLDALTGGGTPAAGPTDQPKS